MPRTGFICCTILLANIPVARAQTAADTARLPLLEVTATRLRTRPEAVTSATTVLTGEELRQKGLRFLLDALREVPGAAVVQTGSFGAITSLFLRGGESDYVKILVDGVPVNLSGGSFNLAHLTTDNVDRIEIVRGPVGVLYGSDAVSGVVQIFTRRSGLSAVTAGAEGGTYGTRRFQAGLAGGGEDAAYSAALAHFGSDGVYAFNNRYRNTTASALLRSAPSPATAVTVSARYTDARARFPTDFAGVPRDSNQFVTEERLTLGVDFAHRFNARAEGRLLLAGSFATLGADDEPDSPADRTGFGFASHRVTTASRRSADARLNLQVSPSTILTAGTQVEYEREEVTSRTVSDFGDGPFTDADDAEGARRTVGAYVHGVAEWPSGVALNAGARVDDSDAFGTFVTARAGVAYANAHGTRLRAAAGTGFKAPTFAELTAATPFEIGNPDLRPERTASWEVGVEQRVLRGRADIGVTWFNQRFRNLIQYRFASTTEPTYVNLGRATARGLEVTGSVRPTRALEASASYALIRTRVTDAGASTSATFAEGRALIRRPAHSAHLGFRYRWERRGTVRVDGYLVGKRDDVDFTTFPEQRLTLDGYATVNLGGEIVLLEGARSGRAVTLTLRVENLFDAAYESAVGFPGRGRTVFAGTAVRF